MTARASILLIVACLLACGCTKYRHLEETYEGGHATWKWETEGSTFLAVKRVEFMVDSKSERGALAGNGISDNFADVAKAQVAIEPELADTIIKAMRPGGEIENMLAELIETRASAEASETDAED